MVTPGQLLELAEQLAKESTEAAHRAAVSRAYYAAYLHLRRLLEDDGRLAVRRQALDHQRVEAAIGNVSEPAQAWLSVLRKRRNNADYDIEDAFSYAHVELALRAARRLLQIRL